MKIILTLGGNSYLLPKNTDPKKVLEVLEGAVGVETAPKIYGPEGEHHYENAWGYNSDIEYLQASKLERVRVEIVDDGGVLTPEQFEQLRAQSVAMAERMAAQEANLPAAV